MIPLLTVTSPTPLPASTKPRTRTATRGGLPSPRGGAPESSPRGAHRARCHVGVQLRVPRHAEVQQPRRPRELSRRSLRRAVAPAVRHSSRRPRVSASASARARASPASPARRATGTSSPPRPPRPRRRRRSPPSERRLSSSVSASTSMSTGLSASTSSRFSTSGGGRTASLSLSRTSKGPGAGRLPGCTGSRTTTTTTPSTRTYCVVGFWHRPGHQYSLRIRVCHFSSLHSPRDFTQRLCYAHFGLFFNGLARSALEAC
ncbi:hypothetical protein B0H11DRAFT_437778 [Mycena galericulata]|nr:hypothetical protein B0H11DRAFT_437778 [Mycena galericulata]